MITRKSSAQAIRDSGEQYYDFNIYHDYDDSAGVTTIVCKGNRLYMMQMEDGKILNFSVDGRNIPADSLDRYKTVIGNIEIQWKEYEEQARRNRAQAELNRQQAQRNREQAQRNREQAEENRQQAERDRQQAQVNREQAERDRQQEEKNREQEDRNRQQMELNREQAERDRQQEDRNREQAELNRQQAQRNREQAELNRQQAEENRELMDSLIANLITDGIVPDRDSVHSLKLDSTEVIVNGKRLPPALEKKYLDKYAKQGLSISCEWD